MNDIDIVYTMWANLKKTAGMEVSYSAMDRNNRCKNQYL